VSVRVRIRANEESKKKKENEELDVVNPSQTDIFQNKEVKEE
jgi:hypothetical protein